MARWQHTVFFPIEGEQFPLSLDETRELVTELRETDPAFPEKYDAQVAAAVFLERLIDELGAQNPPLTHREINAIGLALTRLEVSSGLSDRQLGLRDAILAYELRRAADGQ
jgi:hypothetical protein